MPSHADYVNILALTRDGEALVLEENGTSLGHATWQVVSGGMGLGEDPMAAAQRVLEEQLGYHSVDWRYLSSYVLDVDGRMRTGHFFLAGGAIRLRAPSPEVARHFAVRRVTPSVLQHALWDGRIGASNYAITVALGLLALRPGASTGGPVGKGRDQFLDV